MSVLNDLNVHTYTHTHVPVIDVRKPLLSYSETAGCLVFPGEPASMALGAKTDVKVLPAFIMFSVCIIWMVVVVCVCVCVGRGGGMSTLLSIPTLTHSLVLMSTTGTEEEVCGCVCVHVMCM